MVMGSLGVKLNLLNELIGLFLLYIVRSPWGLMCWILLSHLRDTQGTSRAFQEAGSDVFIRCSSEASRVSNAAQCSWSAGAASPDLHF